MVDRLLCARGDAIREVTVPKRTLLSLVLMCGTLLLTACDDDPVSSPPAGPETPRLVSPSLPEIGDTSLYGAIDPVVSTVAIELARRSESNRQSLTLTLRTVRDVGNSGEWMLSGLQLDSAAITYTLRGVGIAKGTGVLPTPGSAFSVVDFSVLPGTYRFAIELDSISAEYELVVTGSSAEITRINNVPNPDPAAPVRWPLSVNSAYLVIHPVDATYLPLVDSLQATLESIVGSFMTADAPTYARLIPVNSILTGIYNTERVTYFRGGDFAAALDSLQNLHQAGALPSSDDVRIWFENERGVGYSNSRF